MSKTGDEMILNLAAALQGFDKTAAKKEDKKCEKCKCDPCECEKEEKKEEKEEKEEKTAVMDILHGLSKLAQELDEIGADDASLAVDDALRVIVDGLNKGAARKKTPYKTWKGPGEKPPKGAEHKAPKKWFDKMKKDIKKKNPEWPQKRVNEVVGDIWDNQLSDKKRAEIVKKYK